MDAMRLNTDVVLTDSHIEKMRAEITVSIFFHIIIPFYLEAALEQSSRFSIKYKIEFYLIVYFVFNGNN